MRIHHLPTRALSIVLALAALASGYLGAELGANADRAAGLLFCSFGLLLGLLALALFRGSRLRPEPQARAYFVPHWFLLALLALAAVLITVIILLPRSLLLG